MLSIVFLVYSHACIEIFRFAESSIRGRTDTQAGRTHDFSYVNNIKCSRICDDNNNYKHDCVRNYDYAYEHNNKNNYDYNYEDYF